MSGMVSIIVHGGAEPIPEEKRSRFREGCEKAAEAGWEILSYGGSAVDAVEAAIRAFESDPTFNAGVGAQLNHDGEVQMDAAVMDGEALDSGAVAYIQAVRHPISIARRILAEGEVLLVGDGAQRYAEEKGCEICHPFDLVTEERENEWRAQRKGGGKDTVGCVARDQAGHIAAGASTGGLGGVRRGRVGDTPIIGSGVYADDGLGGCACTGDGESIAKVVLAKYVVDRLGGESTPDEIAATALDMFEQKVSGEAGLICIDSQGAIGWNHDSAQMSVAYRTAESEEIVSYVEKSEEEGEV